MIGNMWVVFICSALVIALIAMVICWIGFKIWLCAKKEIKKCKKEKEI